MRKERFHRDVKALAAKAMANGGVRLGSTEFEWNISGDCEDPYTSVYYARPPSPQGKRWVGAVQHPASGGRQDIVVGTNKDGIRSEWPISVEIQTRCRNCGSCMNAKSNIWRHRIAAELSKSPRSWFGTFTLRPQAHYQFLMMARQREGAQGVDFDALDERERIKLIDRLIGYELSLWLKRLREAYRVKGGRLRHIIVAEQHKSGLVHYHAMIHQRMVEPALTHRMLEYSVGPEGKPVPRWPFGFTQWRLVRDHEEAAGYATKAARYASKSLSARVRASQAYGSLPPPAQVK